MLRDAADLQGLIDDLEGILGREVMNAREAADFLRLPHSEFRRIAPTLPRHRLTERRFVYYRGELLDWLLAR